MAGCELQSVKPLLAEKSSPIICWIATQRKTGGGNHEPDPVGEHEWA